VQVSTTWALTCQSEMSDSVYRVRGVDGNGSCAKHLTVESSTVICAANSHTYY